jgi:hypothetical protein
MAKAKRGKRSGGASGHASVRGGLKARTPFLRAGTHGSRSVLEYHKYAESWTGWALSGTDTNSVGLVRGEE